MTCTAFENLFRIYKTENENIGGKQTMSKVRTRFAPSPTGRMHVGNLRTALYAYLIAKHEDGDFMLRIEDTDQERYVEGATEIIYRTLETAGLKHDEGPDKDGGVGPYVQSDRVKSGIRAGILINTIATTLIILVGFPTAPLLLRLVAGTSDAAVIDPAVMYIRISMCCFYVLGPLFVLRCAMQGLSLIHI